MATELLNRVRAIHDKIWTRKDLSKEEQVEIMVEQFYQAKKLTMELKRIYEEDRGVTKEEYTWCKYYLMNIRGHLVMSGRRFVFLSGAWIHAEKLSEYAKDLKKMGYIVEHEWYEEAKSVDVWTVPQLAQSAEETREALVECCDLHVVIMDDPDYAYRGTFFEMGISTGLGTDVYLFNPHHKDGEVTSYATNQSFYWSKQVEHFTSWKDLLDELSESNPPRPDTSNTA